MKNLFTSDFSTLSTLQKVAFFLLLPVGILFLLWKFKDTIASFMEDKKRSSVDAKSDLLDKKINESSLEEAKESGKIESLEKEKENAIEKATSEDSVSFHNSRKPRS